MEIFCQPQKKENLSLALGFFDGIHLGHKKVIENAVNFAKEKNIKSAVVSFVEHPTCFLLKKTPYYITSIEDKIKILENLKVDFFYLLNFDEKMANMKKEDYFEFLTSFTSPKAITTGFNHFFAKDKEGNTSFLKEICKKNNIIYQKISPVELDKTIISSSIIRKAITNADLKQANQMLGYNFFVNGKIISGNNIGEKLGFKTINIKYPNNIIRLPHGIYYTKTEIDGKTYKSITNWGIKPTISNNNEESIETHIFNFDENCYGKNTKIIFEIKIRDEKKFDTLDNLKNQIKKDIEFCLNC